MLKLTILAARIAVPVSLGARWARYRLTGYQRSVSIIQNVAVRGGDVLAVESRVMKAVEGGQAQYVGKVILDVIVKLPNRAFNTLIESKGVRWDLWGTSGWNGYLEQLVNQASKFSQATHAANGVSIGERVIAFATRIPPGMEQAGAELTQLMAKYYNHILWGEQALQQFFDEAL
jgi:hypothetical protein